jgi:hypothetical protein
VGKFPLAGFKRIEGEENMDNVFYITYNPQLKKFLTGKRVYHSVCGLNPKSNKIFWVYDRTKQEFNDALDEWIANRVNK